jgi:hypothetical protein
LARLLALVDQAGGSNWRRIPKLCCLRREGAAVTTLNANGTRFDHAERKLRPSTLGGYPPDFVSGFCFKGPASYSFVTSPVHSGHLAAAFTATAEDKNNAGAVRCVRQSVLPTEAYYGAWYYIPATATNNHLWNLFHFQGADSLTATVHGLWDLSLFNGPDVS